MMLPDQRRKYISSFACCDCGHVLNPPSNGQWIVPDRDDGKLYCRDLQVPEYTSRCVRNQFEEHWGLAGITRISQAKLNEFDFAHGYNHCYDLVVERTGEMP